MPRSRQPRRWPGRPYYGWVIVGVLALTETVSFGVLAYAFAVFLVPMQHELGWSPTAITGAYSLAVVVSGLAAIPVGWWLDRHGARALMTLGSGAATALVLAWSQIEDLTAFYAIWAGIGLVMAAVLYEPAFAVNATWFTRARHQALAVLTVVAEFASVVFTPLTGWLVEAQGWRGAMDLLRGPSCDRTCARTVTPSLSREDRMYLIRERFFRLGEDSDITDEQGQPVLHVDGKVLTLHDRLVLRDPAGREVAQVHRKLVTLRPTYQISVAGQKVAEVRKHLFTPFGDRFTIDIPGPDDMEMAGDLFDHEYTIRRGEQTVATVSKRWFSVRDTYAVDVTSDEDALLILASVLALDLAEDREREQH